MLLYRQRRFRIPEEILELRFRIPKEILDLRFRTPKEILELRFRISESAPLLKRREGKQKLCARGESPRFLDLRFRIPQGILELRFRGFITTLICWETPSAH
jgi:hypothetical protein